MFFIASPKTDAISVPGPKEVYTPKPASTASPVPMHDPERRWSPVDDARLINFHEAKKTIEEMVPHFPGRNFNGVKSRLQHLRNAGKIQGRYKKKGPGRPRGSKNQPPAAPVKPSTSPPVESVPRETPAPTPTSIPTVTPISTSIPILTAPRNDAQPFQIRTTLTLNLNVNCADPTAVDAAILILKEVRRI